MSPGGRLIPKLLLQLVGLLAVFALFLLTPGGTWSWPSAWAFMALFALLSLVISLWLAKVDPGLLAERMASPVQKDQKPWDRVFLGVVALVYFGWMALMALDARRFGWSHVPLGVQVLGALLIVASYAGIAWVFATNSFAAPVIKIQAARKQTVIDTGPYAIVRHPMYAFALLQFAGAPLMLGSWWGLAILPIAVAGLAWRTLGEERMLRAELDGYEAYARRVRFRYAPGIW